MGPILVSLLVILLSLLIYITIRTYKKNKYWEERGIPHIKPILFLGNCAKMILRKQHISELHESICKQFPTEQFVGFYDFMKPVILVKDVDLIEKILIKDFMHFTDHGFEIDEKTNPLDSNLFTMTGKRWRALRIKLSPIFTSGKLRFMFGAMNDCGNGLLSLLDNEKEQHDVDMKEILGRFSMDVIGSCGFGIDAKNLTDPDNEFRRIGRKQFEMDFVQFLKFIAITNFPNFFKTFGISFNKPEVINYFCGLIKNTLNYRKNNNIRRNDFIQLMIQLQQKGYVELQTRDPGDDYLQIDTSAYKTETFEISDDLILGQAFVFLTSGFEGAALVLTYILYELAKHPEIMQKVKKEIKENVKNDGSLTYDSLRGMTYLEQCIKETLRKHPPAPMLSRICTKEYELPNGYVVPVGELVLIPIKTIHFNPEYYPDPTEFKPERFDQDRVLPSCAYIPFGNGPRMCIAMRFAMLQVKYGLTKLLMRYNFALSSKTIEPLELDKTNIVAMPKRPIYFNISKD